MKIASCNKCPKTFRKPTATLAEQALRMHVGRVHTHSIPTASGRSSGRSNDHSGFLRQHEDGHLTAVGRSKLTRAEIQSLVDFIRAKRNEFANKTACFSAALEVTGLNEKIKCSSTSVQRYFIKAGESAEDSPKRKYANRKPAAVEHEIRVNYCPNCGCNIHAVAKGMATALLK